jgi:hypothetical protein
MSNMATIHITRAEAVRDIENVLDQAAAGTDIVIESETGGSLLLLHPADLEYEAWLRADTLEGLSEANDPNAVWISNDIVADRARKRQDALLLRVTQEAG